jgi:hypothetical protein
VIHALNGRGAARVRLGQWRQGIADVEQALQQGTPTAQTLYRAARTYAQAAGRVELDPQQQTAAGRDLRRGYQDYAVKLLSRAIELVPKVERTSFWRDTVAPDPAFRPIRATLGYQRLAESYARPAEGAQSPPHP